MYIVNDEGVQWIFLHTVGSDTAAKIPPVSEVHTGTTEADKQQTFTHSPLIPRHFTQHYIALDINPQRPERVAAAWPVLGMFSLKSLHALG